LVEGLLNAAARFLEPGVIDGHPHQTPWIPGQRPVEDGLKQLLRLPLTTGEEKILGAPALLGAAVGPDDAGDGPASEANQ
jgi:hypothetical protein